MQILVSHSCGLGLPEKHSSGSLLQIHVSQAPRCLMKFPTWLPLSSLSLKGHRKVAVEITSKTSRQMTNMSALQKIKSVPCFLAYYKISSCPVWAWQLTAEGKSCFLSSVSTSAELGGSCSSSHGRVGLHRNPPNYRITGSGAKSKWSDTVLRSGFVLCVLLRWRLLNLLWAKAWGIRCNFCLSWPGLTHTQLAEAWRASEFSRDSCLWEELVGA